MTPISVAILILLMGGVLIWLFRPQKKRESLESLLKSSPKVFSARHCVFCGEKLSLKSNKYLERYLDFSNIFKGQIASYIYPFCEHHDPIQLKSPLPEYLEKVLSQGRLAILPHEESRSSQASVTSEAYVLAGQSVGQFAGNMWTATGFALAGALVAHLKNAPEKVQEIYTKNQDLLLRINLIEFEFLRKSPDFLKMDESVFKPLKFSIDSAKNHLKVRLELMEGLGDTPEYLTVIQNTLAAQKELAAIESAFHQVLHERKNINAKMIASDDRLINGLNKLKQARMAGLISEESYQREVEALKKKEAG